MPIMQYKLTEDASDMLWLFEEDGNVHVVLETDGWWKIPDKGAVIDQHAAELYNSQTDVTGCALGELMLQCWHAAGCPRAEMSAPPTEELYATMVWAPEPVLEYYRRVSQKASQENLRFCNLRRFGEQISRFGEERFADFSVEVSVSAIFGKGVKDAVFPGPHLDRVPANRPCLTLSQRLRGLQKLFDFFFLARLGFELRPNG